MRTFLALHLAIIFSSICVADELSECRRLAPKYQAETEWRIVDDGSRIDLLNKEFAIEVDWSHKWPEAIGQSLFYALKTNRKPAIILLVKDQKKEARFINRCILVCKKHKITLYLEQVNVPNKTGSN